MRLRAAARGPVRLARRLLAATQFLAVLGRLLLTARRRPVQLWIGDSHAVWLNRPWPAPTLSQAAEDRFVWHLGPRLMYSLARRGYPVAVQRVARLLRVTGAGRWVTPVFVAGEIDVRCHLADHVGAADPFGFVAHYVAAGRAVARAAGAARALFVVPVPPSDEVPDYFGFPVRGTLAERLSAFTALRAELLRIAAEPSPDVPVAVVDATTDISAPEGGVRVELTVDGCHLKPEGARFVHARLAELDAAPSAA
jgi:hypothetical protein